MAKKEFIKSTQRDLLLFSTGVENLFINELLPVAPGEYVKVYLFCLMYAESEQEITSRVAANVLGMTEEEIDKAWAYWEDKGAVRRVYDPEEGRYQIEFLSQIDAFYGLKAGSSDEGTRPEEPEEDEAAALRELELRGLYTAFEEATGRPISRKESDKIRDAINVYSVTPDVFAYAIKYCAELQKYSVDYVFTVALRWTEDGCKDISQVKERLDQASKRNSAYTSIFREMGFQRMPNPADRAMMSSWMDEMGFKLPEILEACRTTAGMREPSLRYVNRVLENRLREAGGIRTDRRGSAEGTGGNRTGSGGESAKVSKRVLGEYYAFLRDRAEETYQRRLAEAKDRIPGMADILALENEFNRAIVSFDFSSRAKEERRVQMTRKRELDEQKRKLLERAGLPEDYLEKHYRCENCKDTGVTDNGQYCPCTRERADEAYLWNRQRIRQDG